VAEEAGRPYLYLEKPDVSKEDLARRIAQERRIEKGLVCVLYAVEPCQAFDLYRNREQKPPAVGQPTAQVPVLLFLLHPTGSSA